MSLISIGIKKDFFDLLFIGNSLKIVLPVVLAMTQYALKFWTIKSERSVLFQNHT